MPLLGTMIVVGGVVWFTNSVTFRLKERIVGRADDATARYRAMCFQARAKFLEDTRDIPPPNNRLGVKGWLNGIAPLEEKNRPRKGRQPPTNPG